MSKGKISISMETILDLSFILLLFECIRDSQTTRRFLLMGLIFSILFFMKMINRNSMPLYKPNVYFLFKILFIVISKLMILYGDVLYPTASNDMLKLLVIDVIFVYLIYSFILMKNNIEHIMHLLIFIAIALGSYTLFFYLFSGGSSRLGQNAGYNANSIAMICTYASAFGYYQYLLSKKKSYLVILSYLLFLILLTGSRKGLIGFIACILIVNIILTKRKEVVLKIIGMFFAMVIVYIMILNIPFLYNLIGYRIEGMVDLLLTGTTEEGSMASRNILIQRAMEKIVESPWWGYGLNSFRYYDYHGLYSHNNYVELLFSGGIVLLALYYALHLWVLAKCLGLLKKKIETPLVATVLSINLVMLFNDIAMVSYYSKYIMILQLFMVIILNQINGKKDMA